jgi:hypothetical protein
MDQSSPRDSVPSHLQGRAPDLSTYKKQNPMTPVKKEIEVDEQKLLRKRKDVSFGYNTRGYDRYIAEVPKDKRKHPMIHPRTPDATEKMSNRRWNGLIKAWRIKLHEWDPEEDDDDIALADAMAGSTTIKSPQPKKKSKAESSLSSVEYSVDTPKGAEMFMLMESQRGKDAPLVEVSMGPGRDLNEMASSATTTTTAEGKNGDDSDDEDVL